MNISLKSKIIVSFIAVIVTTSVFSTIVGIKLIDDSIVPRIQDRVRQDLNSAHELFYNEISNVSKIIQLTSTRFFINESIRNNDVGRLQEELEKIRNRESLDILNLTDAGGRILVRTRYPELTGDDQSSFGIVESSLKNKSLIASVEIISEEKLLNEGQDIQERAQISVIPAHYAHLPEIIEETTGMFIMVSSPVINEQNKVLGVIYGGKLMNNNNRVVDRIRDAMYGNEAYGGRAIGSVTLFLHNLRIATNVIDDRGLRSIGTLISEEVYLRVVEKGETLNKIEFAVNDWYITAYEPIKNHSGDIIGVLGIGVLESKYKDMERKALLIFIAITLVGIILSLVICYSLTKSIMRPINAIYKGTQKLADGDLFYRVELQNAPAEIASLSNAFNYMAASIKERDEQLVKNTQQEIMKSERLAMVGQLAAGVAHEINNPLGGILLFSGILMKKAPPDSSMRENIERIEREAKRCQNIIHGLLDFAREREPKKEMIDINDVVEKTINLFVNQPMFQNIELIKNNDPDVAPVFADPTQIQQVFANIILNAVDAMEKKGALTIATSDVPENNVVEILFADTGKGITDEQIDHIFEPFYTTKGVGHGTGLGLSISYGIIQRHGGNIKVYSKVGEGSTFIVQLPRKKELIE